MEQIVRAILNSRTVSLVPVEGSFDIYGFKCLGMAEKPVDIENMSDSLVYIWHVKSDILPVSRNEIERWSIDAPGDRHWILSEREIPADLFRDFPDNFRAIIWGPEKLSRWIGESVLRGDLIVGSNPINGTLDQNPSIDSIPIKEKTEIVTLKTIFDLEDWLNNEPSGSINSIPVFLVVKLWKLSGVMISPDSTKDSKKWSFIEDPWMNKIFPFTEEQIFLNPPNLHQIQPSKDKWLSNQNLKSNLKPILDYRKKEKSNDGIELVKSTMLEWWRVDLSSLNLDFEYAQIPAWRLKFDDGEEKILHSHNGMTYNL